jgi:NADPH:quinone reductase-like Zn-dependent oxidoreductase
MSLRDAATISMCGLTAAQGLFYRLGIPLPPDFPTPSITPAAPAPLPIENPTVLVYAGSTSLGMYALQLARRALPTAQIIAVASPKHAAFLRAAPYGADAVVDYRNDAWPEEVRALAPHGVHYALDCISEGATVERVHATLGEEARLAVFRSPAGGGFPPDLRVPPVYGAVWEGLGHDVGYNGGVLRADPAARAFAVAFDAYLAAHPLEPNPTRLLSGGLERVTAEGFALLGGPMVAQRADAVVDGVKLKPLSGEKAVFELVPEQ